MEAEILAIADADRDYLEKFVNYFSGKYNGLFECHAFSEIKKLLEFGLENRISVLLLDEALYEESIRRMDAGNVFLLSDGSGEEAEGGICRIDRYRPVDGIIREVLKTKAESTEETGGSLAVAQGRVFTVFSPVSRVLKTTFAVAMGQILSDRGRTLYLNLEPYAGFHQIFMQKYDADLSDLLFYLKGNNSRFRYKLQSMVLTSQGLDYVPPAMSPEDLLAAGEEEWLSLVEAAGQTGYDYIILDPGLSLHGMTAILKKSERIYMPVRQDSQSKAKLAQLDALFRISGNTEIMEKTERLQFPYFEDIVSVAGNLRSGSLGSFIRERVLRS